MNGNSSEPNGHHAELPRLVAEEATVDDVEDDEFPLLSQVGGPLVPVQIDDAGTEEKHENEAEGEAEGPNHTAPQDLLYRALSDQNWEYASHLIKRRCGLDYKDTEQWGVLHIAIFNRAPADIVREIIKGIPLKEINAGISNGSTPIYLAAETKSVLEVVRSLLEHGADPNQTRHDTGGSALTMAAQQNVQPELMRLLLEHGPKRGDPNHRNNNHVTPVYMATQRKASPELLEVLLRHGGDPNIPNKEGATAVWVAVLKNVDPELLKLLLEQGGNPHSSRADGSTPLSLAAANPFVLPSHVLLLMQYGADPHKTANKNMSAIEHAMLNANTSILGTMQGAANIQAICLSKNMRLGSQSPLAVLPIDLFRTVKGFLYG